MRYKFGTWLYAKFVISRTYTYLRTYACRHVKHRSGDDTNGKLLKQIRFLFSSKLPSLFYTAIVSVTVICQGEGAFEFSYTEQADNATVDVVSVNVTLNGSYANLGDWPHWCLGSLSRCTNGLTVELWARFADVPEDSSDVIVFTTGGHTWYSNGIYLLQVG